MGNFLTHPTAGSVVGIHNFGWMFVQATVAILILVGFESVTAMGGEAKNAKRDVPIAVITSLLVQGAFCYLFEYFAANYFLNSGYTMQSAAGSAAPIGDMMIVVGDALFGPGHGRTFMLIEAVTVFLALIGTTLSCINTGARVTYAMGKDQEVPEHFGMLHDKNLSPHRAIWTLAIISAVIGVHRAADGVRRRAAPLSGHGNRGVATRFVVERMVRNSSHDHMAALPNTLTMIVLASNFGTFMLYMLSCIICIVAYQGHPNFSAAEAPADSGLRRAGKPRLHGLLPHRAIHGVRHKDGALRRLGIAAVWAIYGAIYFTQRQQGDRAGQRWSRAARGGGPDRAESMSCKRIGADAVSASQREGRSPRPHLRS